MSKMKKLLALLLAAVLCLSMAACGGSADDVAGDDWRVSGVVAGSGTITHDRESVDVLVTISPTSAAFYRDLPEQVLFDSVLFPMEVPDAEQAFNAISFDDIDGDGESDVLVSFIHENNDLTELIWIWDPVERYVFREDLSTVTIDGGDIYEYVGLWEYQGENLWLRIYDDATWESVNDQEDVLEYGTLWVDEDGVTLSLDGSDDVLGLDCTVEERSGPDNDNWMTRSETLFRGVVLRCKNICAPGMDITLNEQFQERKGGDLTDPAVFRKHFAARNADGQPADELVTPQLRALVRRLEEFANNGKVGGLVLRSGELTLALNTGYVFANVPNAIDMRDIDGIRKWFTASLNGMAGLLDILRESPALTGHVSQA